MSFFFTDNSFEQTGIQVAYRKLKIEEIIFRSHEALLTK